MSEEIVTIEAKVREKTGKILAKRIRATGWIPANLLDNGKCTSIEIDGKLLPKAYKSSQKMFNLSLAGKVSKVEIKELQVHALKRVPLHLDLMLVKG